MISWPDTRLSDLLGLEHPIIQAPMLGSCTPALAAAVANAGALGSLGCATRSADWITEQVNEIRARTNQGFNLNFFIRDAAETAPEVLEAMRARLQPWYDRYGLGSVPAELPAIGRGFTPELLELMLELRPRVVSFHFGLPAPDMVNALKDAGITILCSATNTEEACQLEAQGVDAIIAQSFEAGGHRGSFTRTPAWDAIGGMALVPQIVDCVEVPVIASGGIADGRGIAAAFALGASGVQIGTAFLQAPETATDPARRARLAGAHDTDTMMIDSVSGRAARGMRSQYSEAIAAEPMALPDFLQLYALTRPLIEAAPDEEASFMLYGQSAALGRAEPAAEIVTRLVAETEAVMRRLTA